MRSGERLDLIGEVIVSFLMSLTQENNYAQVSRFNPHIFVSFFELATKRKTMLVASS
jgi:hypothetical protein